MGDAARAAVYAANHATTGVPATVRDLPIIQNAMEHIINLIQNLPPLVVGEPIIRDAIIRDAILEMFANTMTVIGGEGLDVDAEDLSRLVIERTDREIIKTFRTPNLTNDK